MPVQIQMAKPANLAGEYLQGVQTGAEIRNAQQRLQQAEREAAMRAQAEQARLRAEAERSKQEFDVEQQRVAVTQSYQQQQIGLRKQALDEAAKMNAAKTMSAARQFETRQTWERGFSAIEADGSLSPEQKNSAKTSLIMRLAPAMGIPGTESAAMIREMRPEKPTVPASVQDNGDFVQVTQPNGTVALHRKPTSATAKPKDALVKVVLEEGGSPTSMARSQAIEVIKKLPPELRVDPVNAAVIRGAVVDMQAGLPSGQATAEKKLDAETAREFKKRAGGDLQKARQMARDAGYTF